MSYSLFGPDFLLRLKNSRLAPDLTVTPVTGVIPGLPVIVILFHHCRFIIIWLNLVLKYSNRYQFFLFIPGRRPLLMLVLIHHQPGLR
jgi:hypothetical protein